MVKQVNASYPIGPVKKKIICVELRLFFSCISLNMGFGCSKEPSHRDGSFEYPQHMFWLRNKKNNFQVCTLIWGSVPLLLILILSTKSCIKHL